MRLGFVIDHNRCIGCHACTVACKEENGVPLGVFRTWVKYVEKGEFPNTRRHFAVLRCNHCDRAPCVTICPTVALFRRDNGIIDFDRERCIGCKACMQACPYDAIHLDPQTNTAAKCHFCAHRVEVGLEPACVIACPTQAILTGDLDDPRAPISRLIAREPVQVRKPEQGTQPKLFYLGADAAALTPGMAEPQLQHMWSETTAEDQTLWRLLERRNGATTKPVDALARTVYDIPHLRAPWGWRVSAYLWTKGIAAGAMLLAALGLAGPVGGVPAAVTALVFTALTGLLLVLDLKRPERFFYIFTKANSRSWLVRGAWVLNAFGAGIGLWLLGAVFGWSGFLNALRAVEVALSVAAAGYSAFLFGQAEGRDFWQSPLLFVHLVVSAAAAGAATLVLVALAGGLGNAALAPLGAALTVSLTLHALAVGADVLVPHPNQDAARAARLLTVGAYRTRFWGGVAAAGTLLPLALLALGGPIALGAAAGLALAGLLLYEDLWIRAGQAVPLS